jgi:hypothetical protein
MELHGNDEYKDTSFFFACFIQPTENSGPCWFVARDLNGFFGLLFSD